MLKNRTNNPKSSNIQLLLQQKKYAAAITVLKKNLIFSLNKKSDLKKIALCYYHLKDYKNSLTYLHQSDLSDVDILMAISQSYYYLGDMINMQKFGKQVITHKMQQYTPTHQDITLPSIPPLSSDPQKNIISFSIFGNNSRYCETAILNVKEAKEIYPHWLCRFYIDDTVPAAVIQRLEQEGAQIIQVEPTLANKINGLFWRFLVIDDPSVERFMIRDADSLISLREAAAVQDWLNSQKHFHVMRDSFAHTELIMAGMWGGCNGIIQNIQQMIIDFLNSHQHQIKREYDQHFLRLCIWPYIEKSYCHHDSTFEIPNSAQFPAHDLKHQYEQNRNFHVGWDINSTISLPSNKKNGEPFQWQVLDQQNNIICQYSNRVENEKFNMIVPIPYLNHLNLKIWTVKILEIGE